MIYTTCELLLIDNLFWCIMLKKKKKRYRFRIVIPAYPAFNIYSRVAKTTTALGPVCVASAVNKMEKWDVEVIDENNLGKFGPRKKSGLADHNIIQAERPADVVGFYGGLTSTISRLYEIAHFYKSKGITTIAGGQHFTGNNIEEALSAGIDYILKSEAELTIKKLLNTIVNKGDLHNIKGLAYRDNSRIVQTDPPEPITDFDSLPLPDFSLVRYANIKVYPVERIRGCGMDCEFCTVKGKPRCASAERLLSQISLLVETRNAKRFFIVDDLFGQQRDQTIRFCNLLADYRKKTGRKVVLTVQIRLDKAKDTELLEAMRQAGIKIVAIGFESPIEEELIAMKKHIKADEMIQLSKVFHNYGFLIHGMFIFGYPHKQQPVHNITLEHRVKSYRDFIKKAKIDTVQVLLPVPLPGTELTARLKQQNRIYPLADVGWEYYDGNFPLFEPDEPLTAEQMQNSIQKIMGRFYQFKYIFLIAANICFFPTYFFIYHNMKVAWQRWYRLWHNYTLRFGGWIILRKWSSEFRKDRFVHKLKNARNHLRANS